ncbi:MAG: cysteine desulfurase NifS [Clostridiales bacterium 43-6]|nr:MAG: cysteine desulfurase NifS [Clostridiales bacterium 43-6]
MLMERNIYVDNAATTRVSDEVLEVMIPVLRDEYGNPSSLYKLGSQAKALIEAAREKVAAAIGAQANEIYFTSGGTESDNWAIKGGALNSAKKGKKHIISTTFEHHAVLHTLNTLEKQGFEVTLLNVNTNGVIKIEDFIGALREDTGLVTVMYANNEIGTIQPIAEIGAICKERGILFHTDAVQAVGNVHINVKDENIDLLSISGHKIHAPKGIGALYIRRGVAIANFIDGGAQERNRRAGTESTASIVGFARAIEIAAGTIDKRAEYLKKLRDAFIDGALNIERSRLNGDREKRLPGNANLSFEGIEGESLLLLLDMNGISASSGSACTSGSLDPSHVLLAIGLVHEVAHGSLRVTFSEENTMEDVDYILEKLPGIVERLRMMSPLWEKIEKETTTKQGV